AAAAAHRRVAALARGRAVGLLRALVPLRGAARGDARSGRACPARGRRARPHRGGGGQGPFARRAVPPGEERARRRRSAGTVPRAARGRAFVTLLYPAIDL